MAYLKHFLAGTLALALLGAGINLFVDPFDIFGMPVVTRINANKSVGLGRFAKPLQVAARKPAVILLGTSRVAAGINPTAVPGGDAYNMAVAGLLAEEMIGFARHAIVAAPVKRMIFGADFVAFNDGRTVRPAYESAILGGNSILRSLPRTLFSYAALKRSRDTLRNSLRGKENTYRADGFHPYGENERARDVPGLLKPVGDFLAKGGGYRNFSGVAHRLSAFKSLLTDLSAQGVAVQVFIPPVHAAQLEAIDLAGLWPLFEDWKRGLAQACADAGIPLWDFAGYGAWATIPLADSPGAYVDSSHFPPATGDVILSRLYGGADPADFGVSVTPATVDAHLADIRRARAAYRQRLPGDIATIHGVGRQAFGGG